MKKFILLILMTLTVFTVGSKAKAASTSAYQVDSYVKVSETEIYKNNYYLMNLYFLDSDEFDRFEGDSDIVVGYLDAKNYDSKLTASSWSLPGALITEIKTCQKGHYDFNVCYIIKPINNYNVQKGDSHYTNVYKLNVSTHPIINGEEIHRIDYDNLLSLDEIKARYSATDNHDKVITDRIIFESDYPVNKSDVKLGKYYITARVSDSSNNQSSLTNEIIVVDTTAPKFSGTFSYILEYGEAFSTDNILNGLTCNDNYEKVISKEKFKITGNKQYDPELLGDQVFEISYTDGSGNRGVCSVKVSLLDHEAPVITVIDTVKISPANRLNEEEILKVLRSSNKISNDYLEASIESDYFEATEEGVYTSLCTVKEKDGSVNLYRFKIDLNSNNTVDTTDNTNLWIIIGVSGGLLLIGGGVGLFFYIKRKRELMQL